jgi:hypothetical protein
VISEICGMNDESGSWCVTRKTRQMYTNVPMNMPIVTWVTQSCRNRLEQARAKQCRDHRQHEQCDRENQREHGRDRAHHRRQDRARVVDAAHRQPRRDVNDAILVEDVRNQRNREQRDRGERELQRDPPQVNVALRTELGRAWGKRTILISNALSSQKQSFQYRTEGQGGKIAQGHHYYQAGSE